MWREESLKGGGGWREGRVNEVGITKDEGGRWRRRGLGEGEMWRIRSEGKKQVGV